MEKYSQFRDRSTGISPFLPVAPSALSFPLALLLVILKVPFLLFFSLAYFLLLQHLPLPPLVKKAILWLILGTPGIWWIDLQIDGVKKGSLAKQHAQRVPRAGNIIASNFTSPLDALYLAAVFDPVFTVSYPRARRVQHISLLGAMARALHAPVDRAPDASKLVPLSLLQKRYPKRVIAVFPECTTTNGRGILPFSPSLLSAEEGSKIFPISLKHSPADMTTPIPGWMSGLKLLWCLCGRVTSCIRVRIAQAEVVEGVACRDDADGTRSAEEKELLDKVSEALARLGRVKRVGLTVTEKEAFLRVWKK